MANTDLLQNSSFRLISIFALTCLGCPKAMSIATHNYLLLFVAGMQHSLSKPILDAVDQNTKKKTLNSCERYIEVKNCFSRRVQLIFAKLLHAKWKLFWARLDCLLGQLVFVLKLFGPPYLFPHLYLSNMLLI